MSLASSLFSDDQTTEYSSTIQSTESEPDKEKINTKSTEIMGTYAIMFLSLFFSFACALTLAICVWAVVLSISFIIAFYIPPKNTESDIRILSFRGNSTEVIKLTDEPIQNLGDGIIAYNPNELSDDVGTYYVEAMCYNCQDDFETEVEERRFVGPCEFLGALSFVVMAAA